MTTANVLVERFIPLANKLAHQKKRVVPAFIEFEELQSAAYLGLVEAASRYDESRGVKFQTYAFLRILGAINDYLRAFGQRCVSLDLGDEEGYTLADTIPSRPDRSFDESLEVVARHLGGNARTALKLYVEDEYSMKEIGGKLGVSESRVSQILTSCKNEIRQRWDEAGLAEELAA